MTWGLGQTFFFGGGDKNASVNVFFLLDFCRWLPNIDIAEKTYDGEAISFKVKGRSFFFVGLFRLCLL